MSSVPTRSASDGLSTGDAHVDGPEPTRQTVQRMTGMLETRLGDDRAAVGGAGRRRDGYRLSFCSTRLWTD